MIMYEQDSDVIRWGLDLLNVDPFPSAAYGDPNHQSLATSYSYSPSVATYYQEDYGRDGNAEVVERSIVENDEVIARALQEEFSQLADAEASENPRAEEEHSKASVLAQDWISPVGTNNPGGEATSDNGDNMEPSSSCSSPEVKDGEGDWALELADDYPMLDGEVGKRLNQMVPIRHVPRINGEIPSVHEAISDHQRLLDRLKLYELIEFKVQGDGNCQFRALSDQFYRTPDHHKFVRHQVVNQLKANREIYEGYVPMQYAEYLQKMSRDGEWGDHVTLQAAADSYGVKIFVITSFKDTCYTEILPNLQKSKRIIFLSFWAEVHYNSIYPGEDLSILEAEKKKRLVSTEQKSTYCTVM